MNRGPGKLWLWLVLLIGGLSTVLFLRKSEAERLRDDLEGLAEELKHQSRPPSPAWISSLRSRLSRSVTDPVTLEVAPHGEISLGTDGLLEQIVAHAANYDSLEIKLARISVNMDQAERRATAQGDALVEVVEPSKKRRSEPRKFAVSFERRGDDWVLVHAKISEPRIDEPEARP